MNKKYIILGLTPQGLSLLRVLGRAGADVMAFCTSVKNVGYHSRYGKKVCYKDIAELKKQIAQIAEMAEEKPVCYISSGEILAVVLREYKELYDICEVYSGPYSVVEMLAHKDRMYEYAVEKGFVVAKYATLDKIDINEFRFPVFLKRNYEIPLFFKAVKVNSLAEYQLYKNRIPEENLKDVIAQEFIDIPTDCLINISCQGFWVNGKCSGLYMADQKRRLRKGITSYIEEITDEIISTTIMTLVDRFMKELGYCGFAEFEFMYDMKNNLLWFIEINTRTCGLQSSMGHKFSNIKDVVLMPHLYQPLQPSVDVLRWMNIQRDIRARFERKDLTHLCDIFHARYDILDWKDPMPFIRQFI